MDQSSTYFDKQELIRMRQHLKEYQSMIEKLLDPNERSFFEEAYMKQKEAIETHIFEGMKRAYKEDGYDLTRQEISEILDISEEQVRRYVIPFVPHIKPPEGAGAFFSLEHNPNMPMIEQRINKWKKVFINRQAFFSFLQDKLYLHSPYSKMKWIGEKEAYRTHYDGKGTKVYALGQAFVEKIVAREIILRRKANIAEVIAEQKKEALFRKTRNEINQALKNYHDGLNDFFDIDRHNKEMIVARKTVDEMKMTVYNAEIEQALNTTKNLGKFYKFELFGWDTKVGEEKRIAVLYWLQEDFVYAANA